MKKINLLILLILFSSPLYAYLDPGSGSMLLYALVGILATFLYSLKNLYYKIICWITGKTILEHSDVGDAKIVFHSEGRKYWNIFKPVIGALDKKNISYAYITPDALDPAIEYAEQYANNMSVKLFKTEMQSILFMNQLRAPLVVSTTPQLDVYMLHRSKHVGHYTHLIHAPTDVLIYKKFAFDFYDSVLCSGPHQIKHIRKLEAHRKTKAKTLYETGCTYFDILKESLENSSSLGTAFEKKKSDVPTILFAPTWGVASVVSACEWNIFQALIDTKCDIIFRPHPQLLVSQTEMMAPILKKLKEYPRIVIDSDQNGSEAMKKSDLLLSDISGIIIDYAFLCQKPIIMVDTVLGDQGYEADGIIPYSEIWEYKIREELGKVISLSEIDDLKNIVIQVIKEKELHQERSEKIKSEYVYNYGSSGDVAANQLVTILDDISK